MASAIDEIFAVSSKLLFNRCCCCIIESWWDSTEKWLALSIRGVRGRVCRIIKFAWMASFLQVNSSLNVIIPPSVWTDRNFPANDDDDQFYAASASCFKDNGRTIIPRFSHKRVNIRGSLNESNGSHERPQTANVLPSGVFLQRQTPNRTWPSPGMFTALRDTRNWCTWPSN